MMARGVVLHKRRKPFVHGLKFKTYLLLIDPDNERVKGLLTKDHFGGEAKTFREAISEFANSRGEKLEASDKIKMLAAVRHFGYVFNPLSVYWIYDNTNKLKWVILEIHNTYGDRHAHLVKVNENSQAEMVKEFYVSPFFTIEGNYKITAKLDERKVAVAVNLHQGGELIFTASFQGDLMEPTAWARLRTPLATHQAMARIKVHGIWLWIRRLPVIKRPVHPKQVGMR